MADGRDQPVQRRADGGGGRNREPAEGSPRSPGHGDSRKRTQQHSSDEDVVDGSGDQQGEHQAGKRRHGRASTSQQGRQERCEQRKERVSEQQSGLAGQHPIVGERIHDVEQGSGQHRHGCTADESPEPEHGQTRQDEQGHEASPAEGHSAVQTQPEHVQRCCVEQSG